LMYEFQGRLRPCVCRGNPLKHWTNRTSCDREGPPRDRAPQPRKPATSDWLRLASLPRQPHPGFFPRGRGHPLEYTKPIRHHCLGNHGSGRAFLWKAFRGNTAWKSPKGQCLRKAPRLRPELTCHRRHVNRPETKGRPGQMHPREPSVNGRNMEGMRVPDSHCSGD
jgi:hypothetical protein